MQGILEAQIFHRESFADPIAWCDHAAQCAALIDALQLRLCLMMIARIQRVSRPCNCRMQDNHGLQ